MREREHVLQLENITMQFGGVVAVNNLSLEVNKGEIVALIGPNGAGKTTAFNVITGVYQPTNGQALFHDKVYLRNHPQGKMKKGYKGENGLLYTSEYKPEEQKSKEEEKKRDHYVFSNHVLAPTPDHITKMGIARTFQNIRLWKSMTVFDNVIIAKHMRAKQNVFSATFRLLYYGSRDCGSIETLWPQACLTASSGVWKLPGPWLRSPNSCCWMNRLPG